MATPRWSLCAVCQPPLSPPGCLAAYARRASPVGGPASSDALLVHPRRVIEKTIRTLRAAGCPLPYSRKRAERSAMTGTEIWRTRFCVGREDVVTITPAGEVVGSLVTDADRAFSPMSPSFTSHARSPRGCSRSIACLEVEPRYRCTRSVSAATLQRQPEPSVPRHTPAPLNRPRATSASFLACLVGRVGGVT